jgi:hypothetical protein
LHLACITRRGQGYRFPDCSFSSSFLIFPSSWHILSTRMLRQAIPECRSVTCSAQLLAIANAVGMHIDNSARPLSKKRFSFSPTRTQAQKLQFGRCASCEQSCRVRHQPLADLPVLSYCALIEAPLLWLLSVIQK